MFLVFQIKFSSKSTMLSASALAAFRKIYSEEFGAELTDSEAEALAANLLTLFDNLYRPIRKEWLDRLLKEEPSRASK